MENNELQLLIHGKGLGDAKPSLEYQGISISEVARLENENYLFLTLKINESTQPGMANLSFSNTGGFSTSVEYEFKTKNIRKESNRLSVNGSDVMYLITPDRFANGDYGNDSTDDTLEKADRNNPDGRHGGDIEGIVDHLDYIEDLGVTSIWLNPVLENDQAAFSYHGYAISDFYKVDSRFGSNQDYKDFVQKCHDRGLKVIKDMVFNHCGSGHWWINDLPSQDWLNQWAEFTRSSFTNLIVSDPYRSKADYDLHVNGWFDVNMPDLNQKNKYLATYLIQNSIWWIEFSNIDGIRMDTYPYPDKEMMANWVLAVKQEYPNFYIVGETWEFEASAVSYWNRNNNRDWYSSNLESVSDYPLYYAMTKAFGEEQMIYRLFENLAYDYLYDSPFNNKIFNGNHDQPRPFNVFNENIDKVKLSFAFILTTRGIPQIYYGDELLFDGPKPDGILRRDFPGGWQKDKRNIFEKDDRTAEEQEVFDFVRTILRWRKDAIEIHDGALKHYKPRYENVYVYFRYLEDKSTMIILNNGDRHYKEFGLSFCNESLEGFSSGCDVISGLEFSSLTSIDIKPNSAYIIELFE